MAGSCGERRAGLRVPDFPNAGVETAGAAARAWCPGISVAAGGQAGDAGRVAALEVWDDSPVPWWSQLRRRLRDDPGVWSLLERELGAAHLGRLRHDAATQRCTHLSQLRTTLPAKPAEKFVFGRRVGHR